MTSPIPTEGGKSALDPRKVSRLLDRIEKHATKWADETAYQFSYEPGSTRYYQANKRAHDAEASFAKAVSELRAALRQATGGEDVR